VDSSLILTNVIRELRNRGELSRLKIFTLGDNSPTENERNDLMNVIALLEHLNIDREQLFVINPKSIRRWKEYLYKTKVFSDDPRIITPNPNLHSQVRHTVMMSALLAYIVKTHPKIKVVLTGDAADEIFAGYDSMSFKARNANEIRNNIVQKLIDLPLNDAARVSLACYNGTSELLENFDGNNVHPIEVRSPFTSHLLLQSLVDAHPEYAINTLDGNVVTKYLLRYVAIRSGVPKKYSF